MEHLFLFLDELQITVSIKDNMKNAKIKQFNFLLVLVNYSSILAMFSTISKTVRGIPNLATQVTCLRGNKVEHELKYFRESTVMNTKWTGNFPKPVE